MSGAIVLTGPLTKRRKHMEWLILLFLLAVVVVVVLGVFGLVYDAVGFLTGEKRDGSSLLGLLLLIVGLSWLFGGGDDGDC
jgi:hypothetical protein